jgi:zinc transporter 2
VKDDLQKIKGVKAAHSLHMWSLTMDKAALAVHLAIGSSSVPFFSENRSSAIRSDSTEDALKIMQKANRMMRYKYNVTFTTVQVEPFDVRFMNSCEQCVGPKT